MGSRQAESLKRQIEYHRREFDLGSAADVTFLRESFDRMVDTILQMEDEGWLPINKLWQDESRKGFSVQEIKDLTAYAERQVKSNNLLGRGLRMKNNYVFGRGFQFATSDGSAIPPRFKEIIEDPENQEVLFSPTALKDQNRVLFTSGNLLTIYDTSTKKFSRIVVNPGLDNWISYDDNPSRVKYWRRSYEVRDDLRPGAELKKIVEWIPVWQYKNGLKGKLPKSVPVGGGITEPVNQNCVIIDLRVNKDDGEVLGAPDCLSALPWAWAANEYLKDGSKLMKALAAIAFHVKAKTQAAADKAGAKLSHAKVGSAAITGPETEIAQLPRAGSIDLYEGRPLQAAVASALDVSVAAITADTAKGGSYASESALSQPEQLAALSRQEDFIGYFDRIFKAMGAKDVHIDFARVDLDPIHRRLQSMGIARQYGGVNQEEFRNASLELLDITPTTTALPEPDEFTGSKYQTLSDVVDAGIDLQKDQAAADAIARQGNSGAVGSLDDNGNGARNDDAAAKA